MTHGRGSHKTGPSGNLLFWGIAAKWGKPPEYFSPNDSAHTIYISDASGRRRSFGKRDMKPVRPPLTKAKNAIRGTFNKPKAPYLKQIRHFGAPRKSEVDLLVGGLASLEPTEAASFLSWLSGYPSKITSIAPLKPVRKSFNLSFAVVETRMSLADRIHFICLLLERSRETLAAFNSKRNRLESLICGGQFEQAEAVLDEIEEEFGLSLWAVELRIALLQISKGLEAQKEYAAGLAAEAPRSAATVIGAWVSQRNEEGTIYARFRSRLRSNVARWKIEKSTAAAYGYLLGLETYATMSDEDGSTVLAAVASVSLIDAYLTIRDALSALMEKGTLDGEAVSGAFVRVAPPDDILSIRLRALFATPVACTAGAPTPALAGWRMGESDEWELLGRRLETIYADAVGQAPAHSISHSVFMTELHRLMELAVSRRIGFTSALDTGLKRLANFRHLDMARAVAAFVNLMAQSTSVLELSSSTSLYLFAQCPSPWQAVVIPKAAALALLPAIPTSPTAFVVASALLACVQGGVPEHPLAREIVAREALGRGMPERALAVAERRSESHVIERRFAPLRVEAMLKLGNLDGAITAAGSLCALHEEARSILPLGALVREARAARFDVGDKLSLALVLHEYLQGTDDRDVFQQLQFAYEDALTANGVERPSELLGAGSAAPSILVHAFLRRIAVPPVMDVSFWLFKTSRDTLSERIAVCAALIPIDIEHSVAYRDEIKEITRLIDIEKGIEDVDRSRVFIDLERLGRWANQELRESFERYKALTRAGIGYEDPGEFEKLLKDFIAGSAPVPAGVFHYPRDEAGQLLIELLDAIVDRYFNDEDFGLDAYLSMRVRHGSIAGHLRGPLEETGLLVARDKSTRKFPVGDEWRDLEPEVVLFSETYEQLVEELTKKRLQIRSTEHPDGLFHFELLSLPVYYIRAGIDEATTLDEFLSRVYEVLDIFLAGSLQEVRTFISNDFREHAEEALAGLAASGAEISPERNSELRNAIAAASPDWQANVDRVASWFAPSEENERAALRTMEQIVEIAVQATRNAHRGFEPKLELDVEDLGQQGAGVLVTFTDILFTILDNVHRHCGTERSPVVKISLKSFESGEPNISRVILRVENDVSDSSRAPSIQKRLGKIKEQISSGDYKSRVKLEGGTGFLKLKRIVAPDNRQTLDFGFIDEGFFVEIGLMLIFYPEGARLEV